MTKIKYHFNSNVEAFYKVPMIWRLFRDRKLKLDRVNPWQLVAKFNNAGLTRQQVKSIFGKYPNEKSFTIPYSKLIENDADIKVRKHGTLVTGKRDLKRRIGVTTCYLLPKDKIAAIFADDKLLAKVIDAGSDYYTDRQRRLIFTQINKQLNYHYKTNAEAAQDVSDEEKIAAVIADIEL